MRLLSSLRRDQKEAIGLLQVGTFLEYFDLMLYVHMAVLLNELFFPQTDPHTAALLSAFAFCSTFVFRPFGALLFGWIGDNLGRKTTVIMTTMMMSVSCIIMANLPTYAQIGITAAWIVTLCRIFQGLSSMGEAIGAEIYITEITHPPVRYAAVAFISVASALGGMAALAIASLVTRTNFNWRTAFWIGAGIAVVGSIARTRLRETPEFVDMKKRRQKEIEENIPDDQTRLANLQRLEAFFKKQKLDKKTCVSYFFIQCGWPICFYLAYIYVNPTLKSLYGYSAEDIIVHNFFLSIILCFANMLWAILSYRYHPLKILNIRSRVCLLALILFPILISQATHPSQIFVLQAIFVISSLEAMPGEAVFISHFPIFKRFTATTFAYASSRAIVYIFTSFGLVYLTGALGHYGLWLITLPVTIGYIWGLRHFEKLEYSAPG